MATEEELEYIARHTGGFDRELFQEHLLGLIEQWKQWTGEAEYVVRITTKDGREVDVAYGRSAYTYFVAFTESQTLELFPMTEITGITVLPRPPEARPRQVGFTIEAVE